MHNSMGKLAVRQTARYRQDLGLAQLTRTEREGLLTAPRRSVETRT